MHTPSTEPRVCTPHGERSRARVRACVHGRERVTDDRVRVKSPVLLRRLFKTTA